MGKNDSIIIIDKLFTKHEGDIIGDKRVIQLDPMDTIASLEI